MTVGGISHVSLSCLLQIGDSTESSDVGPAKEDNPDANSPGPDMQPDLALDDGLQLFLLCFGIYGYDAIPDLVFL